MYYIIAVLAVHFHRRLCSRRDLHAHRLGRVSVIHVPKEVADDVRQA